MLIPVKDKEMYFYTKNGYTLSNKNKKYLVSIGIEYEIEKEIMVFETEHTQRDIKEKLQKIEQTQLRSKASKVEKAIKKFTEWIKIHREKLDLNISKKVLKMAAASD
jgi:hypothetical protein